MGCVESSQTLQNRKFKGYVKQPKMYSCSKFSLPSDASKVRQNDELKSNIQDLANMMKIMANKIQKQDQLIQNLKREKKKNQRQKNTPIQPLADRLENIGRKNIEDFKVLCQSCISQNCRIFTQIRRGLKICQTCYGYGVIKKTCGSYCNRCSNKGYALIVCSNCYGKGAIDA